MENRAREFLDRMFNRIQRTAGFSISEDGVVGVTVRRTPGGKFFAHLLSQPQEQRGWAVPLEPARFFSRRVVIPKEFSGREADYIRYNHPDLIPLPETHSLVLRFVRVGETGETLLHGIRENRLEEFLDEHRKQNRLPKLTGAIPPSVALASAIRETRADLTGKTIAILIGARTTRYLAFKDGVFVNVFDDVHRPDKKNTQIRFRKTLQRVLYYMESEGLGGLPDRMLVMGDSSVRALAGETQKSLGGIKVEYFDLPSAVGLAIPEGTSAEMAILALGAAFSSIQPHLAELNFIGLPPAALARRFDVYDLVIYGSLAVMLALTFITMNSMISSRIHALREDLRANAEHLQALRDEIDSKRGFVPVAEKLIEYGDPRVSDHSPVGRQVLDSLPDFFSMISESIPDGVRLDRMGSGAADPMDETPKAYRSILPKTAGLKQVTLVGQTRSPEKAIRWVDDLFKQLETPVVMEEMNLDAASSTYHFRIVISSKGDKDRA